eukprot:TRINITY_DN13710_c0_g1_i1.p1 TRINITY_DN13710_c0_g1~~TRINITY_DN13710_c0_g1_i1.p1  ORF type:complete len:330 (-),score=37.10 TRINITY_DN13710_c0_g1_i1:21-1010(-)
MTSPVLLVLLSLAYLASSIVFTPAPNALLTNPMATFEEYNIFWNKTHSSAEEKLHRFSNFLVNAEKIELANKQSTSATFGFTQFSDLSAEEFKKAYLGAVPPAGWTPATPSTPVKRSAEQMSNIDWAAAGKTTPVKDQGQCGSCWAFSTTETVESANLIANNPQAIGSPQEIVDCFTGGSGCEGGWPVDALNWIVQQGGQDLDSCYPYTAQDGTCASSQCTVSPNLKISTVTPISADESAMYTALQTAPLSICCDASAWQNYNGGVLDASSCGTSVDHAIQLTGYGSDQGGYWIVRNSWGASWGQNGFIWLQYGQNTCAITSNVVAASV